MAYTKTPTRLECTKTLGCRVSPDVHRDFVAHAKALNVKPSHLLEGLIKKELGGVV